FQRLIGILQKTNTTDLISGKMEATILKSYMRATNLRQWLGRSDCPEVIHEFKCLFDLTFTRWNYRDEESSALSQDGECAHYTHKGIIFSHASTHLGNSLVLYYLSNDTTAPIAGSVQKIIMHGEKVLFSIQWQALLPLGKSDPFLCYPDFPAKTYSSKMEDVIDTIGPSLVLSHCAHFKFSDNCAVILNLSR
ncbi:hypothetical protein B0H10DRAFT_1694206, partial [Mycena sp. CBHHK59/15]